MRATLRRWSRIALWGALAVAACAVMLVVALRFVNPPTSAFMLSARLGAIAHGDFRYRNHYTWVDLEQISPQAAIAVIASEDQQFPFHTGFDLKSIREAVRKNAQGKKVRGASTISQQVAKNLFLWSGKSYIRKGLEAACTLLIEWTWPKERILEVYLNVAQFGPDVYGVEAAAQRYFKQRARKLNRSQSALLASVLPNPVRFKIEAPSAYVQSRRAWILAQMAALGGVQYLEALDAATAGEPEPRKASNGKR
jgi:monofunctional biosynthetic peptidoglycan transglycosylase